jgi:hypothetical protein
MLGFLPWEKLPPLVLGPLMVCAGVSLFFIGDSHIHSTSGDFARVGSMVFLVVGGICVLAYGLYMKLRKPEPIDESTGAPVDKTEERFWMR